MVAERREPPGGFPRDLRMVTGQLALFRYQVNTTATVVTLRAALR